MNVSVYIKESLLTEVKKRVRRDGTSLSRFVEKALEKTVNEPVPSLSLKTLSKLEGILNLGGDALKDTGRYYE